MSISTIVFGAIIAAVVISFAVIFLANRLKDILVYRDQGYGRSVEAFTDDCRARGMSPAEIQQEAFLRRQFAQLRREASNAVAADPSLWWDHIAKAKDDAIKRVAVEWPDLLPAFGKMLSAGNYGDILYDAEARIVDKLVLGRYARPDQGTLDDMVASMKIIR